MTRYTVDQREWTTGPGGVSISVIPGRELVYVVEPLPPPLRDIDREPDFGELSRAVERRWWGRRATVAYITAYLTRHGTATVADLVPPGREISETTIGACLGNHPELFVAEREIAGARGQRNRWRLRGQP